MRQRRAVAAAGDRRDGEAIGRLADHLGAGAADRAGGAEDDQPLRSRRDERGPSGAAADGRLTRSPLEQPGGDPRAVAARPADDRGERRRGDEGVEPIEHAAVARDQARSNP